jgi:hypothetical protein
MENLLESNCLIYLFNREYLAYKSPSDIELNKPINIIQNYINDSHVFRCYTDIFNNYRGKLSDSQLSRILKYGELFHFYIPCSIRRGWYFNVSYIQLHDINYKLFFLLEFSNIDFDLILNSNLYSEFLESYREYRYAIDFK